MANYTRISVPSEGEILSAATYNTEHNNHINNGPSNHASEHASGGVDDVSAYALTLGGGGTVTGDVTISGDVTLSGENTISGITDAPKLRDIRKPIATKTDDYTLTAEDHTILVDSVSYEDKTTIAFVDGGGGYDSITDSANGLAVFAIGDDIVVSGSDNNDGTYAAVTVAAGVIEVATGTLTTEPDVYGPKTTIAFVDGGGGYDSITDSDSGFLTAGFAAGEEIIVSGSTTQDGTYTILSCVAGTIEVGTGLLTAEDDSASITMTSGNKTISMNQDVGITLPTASTVAGSGYDKEYEVALIGTGQVTLLGTISGESNPGITTQYESMTIYTDGTNYYKKSPLGTQATFLTMQEETSAENAGVVTLNNIGGGVLITSVDLGSVTIGDRLFASGRAEIQKGATGGWSDISIVASSGSTATIATHHNQDNLTRYDVVPATDFYIWEVSGPIRVTVSGTLVLEFRGTSTGSDASVAIGSGEISTFFFKKQ